MHYIDLYSSDEGAELIATPFEGGGLQTGETIHQNHVTIAAQDKAQTLFLAAYVRAAAEPTIDARVRAVARASSLYAATVVSSSQALDAICAGKLEIGQFGGGGKAKKDKAELELHADGA
ncbi:hypothetical protein E4U28_006388 [Claviceps purpurea]|nr:hypothetical protein E4U28_006388 [Claviceps purpurea]